MKILYMKPDMTLSENVQIIYVYNLAWVYKVIKGLIASYLLFDNLNRNCIF